MPCERVGSGGIAPSILIFDIISSRLHVPVALSSGKVLVTYCTRGAVGPIFRLDVVAETKSNPGCPAYSQSLYPCLYTLLLSKSIRASSS